MHGTHGRLHAAIVARTSPLPRATLLVLAGCTASRSRRRRGCASARGLGRELRPRVPLADIEIALEPYAEGFDQPLFMRDMAETAR